MFVVCLLQTSRSGCENGRASGGARRSARKVAEEAQCILDETKALGEPLKVEQAQKQLADAKAEQSKLSRGKTKCPTEGPTECLTCGKTTAGFRSGVNGLKKHIPQCMSTAPKVVTSISDQIRISDGSKSCSTSRSKSLY